MHKWLMAVLFYGACALGIGVLIVNSATQPEKPGQEAAVEVPDVPLNAEAAQEIYKQSCLNCHGGNLEGGAGPKLQQVGTKLDQKQITSKIRNGGGIMPAFKGKIKDEDIANLAKWLAEKK